MRVLLPLALSTLLLALPIQAAEEREYIYGAELMSPKERDAYRQSLEKAPTEDARSEVRRNHRERLQKRAQQRGKQLDEKGIVRGQGGER